MTDTSRAPTGHASILIRLADAGNVDAGRWLLDMAARDLASGRPLPDWLGTWLADRLRAAIESPRAVGAALRIAPRRGRQPAHADNANDAMQWEALKVQAAWAVWHEIHPDPRSSVTRCRTSDGHGRNGEDTPFEIVATWLAEANHHYSPDTIRAWYEKRLPAMRAEHERLKAILAELG